MKILKLLILTVLFAGTFAVTRVQGQTLGTIYYVSTTGNDAGTGTLTQPFKTFAKGISLLRPGDTLMIAGGTYFEQLNISKSGTSSAPVIIKAMSGQRVIIDAESTRDNIVMVTGSYVNLDGLEVARGLYDCVVLRGSFINVNNFTIRDCGHFGLRTTTTSGGGKDILIQNSVITGASIADNLNGINTTGGWGSGVRVGQNSSNITLRNNRIYNNWGEGIGILGSSFVNVVSNDVYDNYSINIYIDNSKDINILKNLTYSTNSAYFRSGRPANCISMAEENFGVPAQLARVNIVDNIAAFCNKGIGYTYTELGSGTGLDSSVIAFNTVWGSRDIGLLVINVPDKTRNSVIANNIVGQPNGVLADIKPTSGVLTYNNFWASPVQTISNAGGAGDVTGDVKFANVPGTAPESFRLSSTSPAINKGKAMAAYSDDYESKTRDTIPDMGAIEYTGQVTPPTLTPAPSPTVILGDANGDGLVDETDYSIWRSNYAKPMQGPSNGDFNSNGQVDGVDYAIWLNAH